MKIFYKKQNKACPPSRCFGSRRGFTLVETLIALLIFTMSILALMSVLGSGIADTSYAKKKIVAGYLAQEGIECVRNLRDTKVLEAIYGGGNPQTGWDTFKNLFRNAGGVCPIDSNDPDFIDFTREISANEIGPDEEKISSTVSWLQGSGNYEIIFSENLFNWVE